MSLTFPTFYSNATKAGNVHENWLIQLGYFNGDAQGKGEGGWDAVLQADGNPNLLTAGVNDSTTTIPVDDGTVFTAGDHLLIESEIVRVVSISSNDLTVVRTQMGTSAEAHEDYYAIYWINFTAIAGADTTVDNVFYRGVVTTQPSIRSSIDLTKSTAKVSNISLTLVNFPYKGDDFSAELLSGTRTYLNKDVKVYIQLNGNSTLSNCLHVYTGRLHGIKHGADKISLSIKSYSPWDRVDYPDTYSDEKVLAPLSYGNFTGNSSSYPGVGTDDWRPVPFTNTDSNGSNFVIGTDSGSSLTPSAYVESMDGFVPYDSGTSSSVTVSSVEVVRVLPSGKHSYYQRPTADSQTASESMITEANMANCYNGVTTDGGTVTFAMNVTGSEDEFHKQRFTILETAEATTVTIVYRVTTFSATSQEAGSTIVSVSAETAEGNSSVSNHTATTGSDQTVTKSVSSGISYIDLKVNFASDAAEDTSGGAVTLVVTVYQIYARTDVEGTKNGEIFIDADGTLKNYTSGSVANVHEAHRSLLHDALGLTDTPTNWSALDTERTGSPSAWTIMYWQNKQTPLIKLLEKLQYEGQFIYIYERAAGKYIYIADSPSSIATISQNDMADFSINEVNFDELETKHTINYDPHPAKNGEYREQASQTSGDRTDYNFATNENIINVSLDALAASVSGGSARNDDWATYRQKLFGSIKLTVDFELINQSLSNVEVGDIIDFEDMPVDPGGGSWSGKNFIIIKTSRSPGKLKITAREV